jgi:hypothetical protein
MFDNSIKNSYSLYGILATNMNVSSGILLICMANNDTIKYLKISSLDIITILYHFIYILNGYWMDGNVYPFIKGPIIKGVLFYDITVIIFIGVGN